MSHGIVEYRAKERQWRIEAPPHVVIKMKRVFGKLSRRRHDVIFLSATEENARDLAWFLDRYPMDVGDDDRVVLAKAAEAHRERMDLVARLLSNRVAPPAFDLALPPRDYQRVAAALALATGGLLLADDLGVGKTISAICMLADPRTLPALIVTLTHLPKQWEREIKRFAPQLRTHILKRGKPYDLTIGREKGAQLGLPGALPDVIITNYHKLSGWAEVLAPIVKMVCFDEGHELRNAGGTGKPAPAKYTAAQHIAGSASFRLAMTATPIFNYGNEFHAVMEIIRPSALGTRSEFGEEWCKGSTGDKAAIEDPAAFGAYMRESGFMLRRTRKDVGRELPDLTKIIHQVDADAGALDKVSAECAELARIILKQGGETVRGEKLNASEQLSNRLRQATGIAKAPFVADFVRMVAESGEKVLVAGWHREFWSILQEKLADLKPVMYTGTESPTQKEESRRAFIEGDSKVLLMSLRAGAGLDGLQKACRTVVIGELDWSPAMHEQFIGRIHRDGQPDPVAAYFLIADEGSDPIVVDVLGLKRQQLEGVRDPKAELVEHLEVDGDRIKRLAASYLQQRGIALPAPVERGTAA